MSNFSKANDILEQCPLCHSKNIAWSWKRESIWKCLSCGLLFRNPLGSEQKIHELYKKSWSAPDVSLAMTGGTDLKLARIYAEKLALSLGLKDLTGLNILDFGSGKGGMLTALGEMGADVYGVEPFGYDYLKNKGLKVFRSIDEIPAGLSFHGVTAVEVLEHLFSPWDVLKKLFELLNKGGWLYISTPNANSLNARLSASRWRELRNPGHAYFFTPKNFEMMISKLPSAGHKRLSWIIEYKNNFLLNLPYFLLGTFKLDGTLRYLLYKKQ